MTPAQFTIPDDEMKDMLSTRILDALTDATREKMIREAISFLINPPTDRYGDKKSPLQQAFELALNRVANQVADEVLAEEGVAVRLKEMFVKLITDIPDIYDDYTLQTQLLQVIVTRAREVRRDNS